MKTSNTRQTLRSTILLTSCLLLFSTALADDTKEVLKDFGGRFHTGIGFGRSNGGKPDKAAIFTDTTRPTPITSNEQTTTDNLLKDLCKNGNRLKGAPAQARWLDGASLSENSGKRFIAVFPHASISVGKRFEDISRFEPSALTKLEQVTAKYGKPSDQETWRNTEFHSLIGLKGVVHWWGPIGIACAPDGSITHVLIRETAPKDSKQ